MFDMGVLLIRVVPGVLLAAHGLQKLAGWFGGPGLDGHSEVLRSLGYRRPRALAWVNGWAETAGGLLLAAGLLTPLAAAAVLAVMLNAAVAVHGRDGLWVQEGGYEYPLVLATLAAGVALSGPGAVAVDGLIGWDTTGAWAVAGIIGGLAVGLAVLVSRRRTEPARDDRAGQPGTPVRAA